MIKLKKPIKHQEVYRPRPVIYRCLVFANDPNADWVKELLKKNGKTLRSRNGGYIRNIYWVMNYSRAQRKVLLSKPNGYFLGAMIDSQKSLCSVWTSLAYLVGGKKFTLISVHAYEDYFACTMNPLE